MAVATATLSVALDVGDRLAREFRSLGANLLVTPQSDTLPLQIGGVDYRPVDEGGYLQESDIGKLKTIFWRHNIIGFTPFLDVPSRISDGKTSMDVTVIGTWYQHSVAVPGSTTFVTGAAITHPWWKVQGAWFAEGSNECVIGEALAARLFPADSAIGRKIELNAVQGARDSAAVKNSPVSLLVTGVLSSGDAEDDAILVPLAVAQGISGHAGQYRRLFVSALTKPEDSFSQRDPTRMTPAEYDLSLIHI